MLSLQLSDKILLYLDGEAITIARCDETIHQWEYESYPLIIDVGE